MSVRIQPLVIRPPFFALALVHGVGRTSGGGATSQNAGKVILSRFACGLDCMNYSYCVCHAHNYYLK